MSHVPAAVGLPIDFVSDSNRIATPVTPQPRVLKLVIAPWLPKRLKLKLRDLIKAETHTKLRWSNKEPVYRRTVEPGAPRGGTQV